MPTPRRGKPVEVNALWYNALRIVESFATQFGDDDTTKRCASDADKARFSFRSRFVNRTGAGLYDVVDSPNGDDPTVRPNQIFAVSLYHRMLDAETQRRIVEQVDYHLYTPFGLRSLARNHPDYHATYGGSPVERDGGYHQGPVWGWLWGPYMTAYRNAFGQDENYRRKVSEGLSLLVNHRDERGIEGISEIYDGRAPHAAHGCPWQAWSLAEALRVASEEGFLTVT